MRRLREILMVPAGQPIPWAEPATTANESADAEAAAGQEQLAARADAGQPPATPVVAGHADPGAAPRPQPPAEAGAASSYASRSPPAGCPDDPPPRAPSPAVAALSATRARVAGELETARAEAARLGAAVLTAQSLLKERAVQAAIAGPRDTDARRAVEEARGLLAKAAEGRAEVEASLDALAVASERVARDLEIAVQEQQSEEQRLVAEMVARARPRAKDQLVEALDLLWLDARLRGAAGSAQALLGSVLGLQIHAASMLKRSAILYGRLLCEAKAGKAVAP